MVTKIPSENITSPTGMMGGPPSDNRRIRRVRHFRKIVRHSGVYGRRRTRGMDERIQHVVRLERTDPRQQMPPDKGNPTGKLVVRT